VIVDMALPPDVAANAIRAAKSNSEPPQVTVFFSHVQTELRDMALEAGADDMLPRSVFVEQLPVILRG
jgi:DNA-binding NarL/FixJ family response regulator